MIHIVSGLPRSGTSLMMQMLEAAGIPPLTDDVRTADADNPRGYYELEAVKSRNLAWLDEADGRAVKIISVLLRTLPPDRRYKVILMERDPVEVAASQLRMLERLGKRGASLNPEDLSRSFANELRRAREWLAQSDAFSVLEVNYNQLMADPVHSSREVTAFVGAGEPLTVAAVVDPALHRNKNHPEN